MACCFMCGNNTERIGEGEQGENRVRIFSYSELRKATHGFSVANKIGEGGFGSVFRGRLKDGTMVAVKLLSATSRQGTWTSYEQGHLENIIDADLEDDLDVEQACQFLKVGLLCTQDATKLRPSMTDIVRMLLGEKDLSTERITKPSVVSGLGELRASDQQRSSDAHSLMLTSSATIEPSTSSSDATTQSSL
ncbi:hypothetical protein ABZP36_029354 [Zizania latifolia]